MLQHYSTSCCISCGEPTLLHCMSLIIRVESGSGRIEKSRLMNILFCLVMGKGFDFPPTLVYSLINEQAADLRRLCEKLDSLFNASAWHQIWSVIALLSQIPTKLMWILILASIAITFIVSSRRSITASSCLSQMTHTVSVSCKCNQTRRICRISGFNLKRGNLMCITYYWVEWL